MRTSLHSSIFVVLLAGVSLPALAQDYSVTSPRSGITTTVRSADYYASESQTPPAPITQPAPAHISRPVLDGPGAPVAPAPQPSHIAAPAPTPPQQPAQPPVQQPAQAQVPPPQVAAPAQQAVVQPTTAQQSPVQQQTAPQQAAVHTPPMKLADILATAYASSPALRAEREALRQQYENVAVAESNRRPGLSLDGSVAAVNAETHPGGKDSFFSRDVSITGTQYLYRGGRTLAQIEEQLKLSDAALAAYDAATQDVFLNVVTAAMDIQRDRATIDLTQQNHAVIERALESARNGFKVGELTRTDVAQAQARLSGADAQLVAARADYSSALARFTQYAGMDGTTLNIADDIKGVPVPASLETAKATADTEHPSIRAAEHEEKAAQSTIEVAQGALRPDIYAQGSAGKSWDPSSLLDSERDASIGLRASLPLYDGGASRALIRQAKYLQLERHDRLADSRRIVGQQVATAWNDYQSSLAQIGARTEQVGAATIAREGVYNERQVGTRTVLDTLNADAELLDAQVGLVSAQRDAIVAGYALQAATGQLTGEKLGLFSTDSEKAARDKAQKTWFDTSVDAPK